MYDLRLWYNFELSSEFFSEFGWLVKNSLHFIIFKAIAARIDLYVLNLVITTIQWLSKVAIYKCQNIESLSSKNGKWKRNLMNYVRELDAFHTLPIHWKYSLFQRFSGIIVFTNKNTFTFTLTFIERRIPTVQYERTNRWTVINRWIV